MKVLDIKDVPKPFDDLFLALNKKGECAYFTGANFDRKTGDVLLEFIKERFFPMLEDFAGYVERFCGIFVTDTDKILGRLMITEKLGHAVDLTFDAESEIYHEGLSYGYYIYKADMDILDISSRIFLQQLFSAESVSFKRTHDGSIRLATFWRDLKEEKHLICVYFSDLTDDDLEGIIDKEGDINIFNKNIIEAKFFDLLAKHFDYIKAEIFPG